VKTLLDGALAYTKAVLAVQQRVLESQQLQLTEAADVMERAIGNDGRIFIFGSGHSHMMAEEGHFRAGGLAAVVPILASGLMLHESAVVGSSNERLTGLAKPLLARYNPRPQDCIIVFSNSGVNAVPVEMAQSACEAGMKVIAVVSQAYAAQAPLSTLGVRLSEVAHVTIDNCGIPGDALIPVGESGDGYTIRVGSASTVVGAFILNSLLAEVVTRLAHSRVPGLPVYISANMPGAADHNQRLLERYRPGNPHL
jgi:uncharacterized phosphosugar-binding protein